MFTKEEANLLLDVLFSEHLDLVADNDEQEYDEVLSVLDSLMAKVDEYIIANGYREEE
jgi:hypothetical protein